MNNIGSSKTIGRFAPTPSGVMHIGNILCAVLAYLAVKSEGGCFAVRIEDVDVMRCPRSAAADILGTLEAFGITSDVPVVYQSERTQKYAEAADALFRAAKLYPCFCTRGELHSADAVILPDGGTRYLGTCRTLTKSEVEARARNSAYALRVCVPDEVISFTDGICGTVRQNLATDSGDFVVRRRDGVYAYRLAAVVDDGSSGVTQVVRGADLLFDTPRQIYLQRLLGLPTPNYYHIPLVCDASGRKLSKSNGDSAARLLRRKTPSEVLGALAYAVRLLPEPRPVTLKELVPLFSFDKLPRDSVALSL